MHRMDTLSSSRMELLVPLRKPRTLMRHTILHLVPLGQATLRTIQDTHLMLPRHILTLRTNHLTNRSSLRRRHLLKLRARTSRATKV